MENAHIEKIDYTDIAGMYNLWRNYQLIGTPRVTITKEMIAAFAETTINHQWIHERHEWKSGDPYEGQIAHGLLLLSLVPHLVAQAMPFEVVGHRARVIRGFERVRFLRPVYPDEYVELRFWDLKAYPAAKAEKGTVLELKIDMWKPAGEVMYIESVLSCTLKFQYF